MFNKEEIWSPLAIALIASMTQALGISLQRKSHLLVDVNSIIPLYKRPLWISGFLIYTISNLIGSTCTIGYLPIVILAPVGAIGLVFNAIFAKWILGDPFTKRTVFGNYNMHPKGILMTHILLCRDWIDCIRSWFSGWIWYGTGTKSYPQRLDCIIQKTYVYHLLFIGRSIHLHWFIFNACH
jgi:hypothetical protein